MSAPQNTAKDAKTAPIIVADPIGSRDNEVRPFQLESSDIDGSLRGRAVRLGTIADQVLCAHQYPDSVARILGEALAMVTLLGSMLKDTGVVTLQIKSAGPISMLVTDLERLADGSYRTRGYADVDYDRLKQYGKNPSFNGLIGSKQGYMALTVDPGDASQRYQGIVDINGETLSLVASQYFRESEQTPSCVTLACGRDAVSGNWRAGGLLLQHLSRGEVGLARIQAPAGDDAWNRASILAETIKPGELLDPNLTLDEVLFRLFHEEGVRVFEPVRMTRGCRCSREKLADVLRGFAAEDLQDMVVDGKISVNCQFCNTQFIFDPAEFGNS